MSAPSSAVACVARNSTTCAPGCARTTVSAAPRACSTVAISTSTSPTPPAAVDAAETVAAAGSREPSTVSRPARAKARPRVAPTLPVPMTAIRMRLLRSMSVLDFSALAAGHLAGGLAGHFADSDASDLVGRVHRRHLLLRAPDRLSARHQPGEAADVDDSIEPLRNRSADDVVRDPVLLKRADQRLVRPTPEPLGEE